MGICNQLKIDWKRNSKKSFIILFFYRLCHTSYKNKNKFLLYFFLFLKSIVFWLLRIDAWIEYEAEIGSNIRLPHSGNGLVISRFSRIGNNVTIFHQVTLGVNESLPINERYISISDNCYISVGAKIISCSIGERCKIAPNAVVRKNTPPNSLVYSENSLKQIIYEKESNDSSSDK